MEKAQTKEHITTDKRQPIGVIGLGNMGTAALHGFVESGITQQHDIVVCNRSLDDTVLKLQHSGLATDQFRIAENNNTVVSNADILIVALKQQAMYEEFSRWNHEKILPADTLVVSFAAGVWMSTCRDWLGNAHQPIARVMPNTATASGRGVLGWTISEDATVRQEKTLQALLAKLGTEVQVENDEKVDIITSISGSGPAYIYRFVEAMEAFAASSGFSEDIARQLVGETLIGSAIHYLKSGESASQLRRKITSKGGTTEAAIRTFEEYDIDAIVAHAMSSAYNRARAIGKQYDTLEVKHGD